MPLKRLYNRLAPPRFMLVTNSMGAAFGFAQGIATAAILQPAGFGYVGIFVMLGAFCSSFWDLRLPDLAAKLHYQIANTPASAPTALRQTRNIQVALLFSLLIAMLIGASTALAGHLLWPVFTETKPAFWWPLAQGLASGSLFFVAACHSVQRLTGEFYNFAVNRLLCQIAYCLIIIAGLVLSPTINGFYGSLILAILANLTLAGWFLTRLWRQHFNYSLWVRGPLNAWEHYRPQLRFLLSANIMSYGKMLSRSGDLLVFSFFAGDAATGVYRLARSLSDTVGIFNDAMNQYYYPKILELLTHKHQSEVRRIIRNFIRFALAATLVITPAAYIGAEILNVFFLQQAYTDLPITTALLFATFFWTCGVGTWIWPLLVHANRPNLFAGSALTAGIIQLGSIAFLCWHFGAHPAYAAMATLLYYVCCYLPLVYWWRTRYHQHLKQA